MRVLSRLRLGAREERGSVIVLVALIAPIAILFCAFVIDLGNGWWHQRHLQVQADAAALAAAQDLWPSCSGATVTNDAQLYGGLVNQTNQQVGGTATSNIHQLINSQTWYGQPSPVDSSVATGSPCTTGMVDVKMTETNLPWFFQVFSGVFNGFSYIDAQARVELRQETMSAGDIPIAVNDVNFAYAEAYFINESTGTVLGAVPLSDGGTSNGLDVWTSAANPFNLTVPTAANSDVGVRIALSGATKPTGNMATDCTTAGTLCYDASSANAQLLDVHGFNPTGTGSPAAPVNHGVVMTPVPASGCDQYYTAATTNCADGVQATLDLGNSLNGITVSAVVGGTSYPLACTLSTGNPKLATCVSGAAGIPIAAGSGRNQVDLKVVYTQGQGKNQTTTTTTFTNAQSTYAGAGSSATSGPIQALSLYVNGTSDTSSLQEGSTYPVTLTLGIPPRVSVAQPTDPPITMRFNNVGSQNQSVSCTPASNPQTLNDPWTAALATGCAGPYQVNQTLTCPDNNSPVDCVPPATGDQTNKVAKALNYRILGNATTCSAPNHWPTFPASDPRIVTVFITPYDSFGSSGSSTSFPIQSFAAFYVTGWQGQGQGNNNPCQGNGDDPAPAGTMVGHFIHYVQFLNNGGGGTQTCAPNSTSLNECVAVMTR